MLVSSLIVIDHPVAKGVGVQVRLKQLRCKYSSIIRKKINNDLVLAVIGSYLLLFCTWSSASFSDI